MPWQIRNVENALRAGMLFRNSPYPVGPIFRHCGVKNMAVLGTLNYPELPRAFNPLQLSVYVFQGCTVPQVFCPTTTNMAIQIITFDQPDPERMQYISLQPMNLALGSKQRQTENSSSHFAEMDVEDEEEEEERTRLGRLVEKLKLHTVVRHSPTRKEMALGVIVNQINCCLELANLLQRNSPFIGPRRKRSMSMSERVVESAQSLYTLAALFLWNVFRVYVYPIVHRASILALIIHRIIAEGILVVLEWHLPSRTSSIIDHDSANPTGLALKDLFASCQQVHIRLQQFSYYPMQYMLLRKRHMTWSSIHPSNTDYIRYYNSLWLIANDVIIGIALGSYIIENAQPASDLLSRSVRYYTIDGLTRMIRWLMSYPGGLKLNNELAAFLGDLFLWVIEYWSTTTTLVIMPYLPTLVYFIGYSSFAGASMPIAIFSDLLSLLTLHVYSFYVASARIFNWQLTIIYSLFQLFRGKKRNMLRNRIDNCDYDLDQLLLGTILFTLLFFLLPTVGVFYLTFATARMAIISLKAILDTCLACLNHFPLFALMLRLKDSRRLPGGIRFRLIGPRLVATSPLSRPESLTDPPDATEHDPADVSYIDLSSTPLSLREIFAPYFHLGARVRKHYLSPKVVLRLITGRFVPPLGRSEMYGLQYSMLPANRVKVGEVWQALTATNPVRGATVQAWPPPNSRPRTWGYNGSAVSKRWK
jgi:phosphatidylinositol glycan class Q protein